MNWTRRVNWLNTGIALLLLVALVMMLVGQPVNAVVIALVAIGFAILGLSGTDRVER